MASIIAGGLRCEAGLATCEEVIVDPGNARNQHNIKTEAVLQARLSFGEGGHWLVRAADTSGPALKGCQARVLAKAIAA